MLISYCVLVGFRWPQMMHRHSPLHRIFRHKAIVLRNHPTYNPNAGCAESGPHYAQNPWSEPGNFWWWSLGTTLTVWTIVTDNTCAECGPHHAQTSLLRGRPGMCRMGFSDRHLCAATGGKQVQLCRMWPTFCAIWCTQGNLVWSQKERELR